MEHGTVCVQLMDGTTDCPTYLLPKKHKIQREVTNIPLHDRIQLAVMQDSGVNLNHAMNVTQLIQYYNAHINRQKATADALEGAEYAYDLALRGVERFTDIAHEFTDTMNRLTGLQYQIMGTTGDLKKAAHAEFKSAYREAVGQLQRLGDYHLINPETDAVFYSKRRVMNRLYRDDVYVNDIADVKALQAIATRAKWVNCGMLGLGVLASAADVVVTYKQGGDWKTQGFEVVSEFLLDSLAFKILLVFAPEGWIALFVTSAIEVLALDVANNLYEDLVKYVEKTVD